jgi:hypothetical protein
MEENKRVKLEENQEQKEGKRRKDRRQVKIKQKLNENLTKKE